MDSTSIVITSANEPQTISRAIKAILDQDSDQIIEILVVAPDEETLGAALRFTQGKQQSQNQKIKIIKDLGKGKPSALNLAFKKAKGDILVLTDGDVYVSPNALSHLLAPFGTAQGKPSSDSQVGGTCGRPIPTNERKTMLGFWSFFLTDAAHLIRFKRQQKTQFLELSGYLLAIRKSILLPNTLTNTPITPTFPISLIPPNTLADDSYLSHLIAKANFKTAYAPQAKVFVKYPTTLSDWFKQKKRTSLEYWQNSYSSGQKMRSPASEIINGLKFFLTYPKNLKEFFWLVLLFKARLLLWLQIFILSLTHSHKNLWHPVASTKH